MLSGPSEEGEIAVDEAGRGCLAFDVCAAAVIFPRDNNGVQNHTPLPPPQVLDTLSEIKDSKKLSETKRQALAAFIKEYALSYGLGTASPAEIDRVNILHATHAAMHRALDETVTKAKARSVPIRNVVVDGDRFEPYLLPEGIRCEDADAFWLPYRCVARGDAELLHVAAASILAKTHRDALVREHCERDALLDVRYGFLSNKAYGSSRHLHGLREYGPTVHHRFSYAPVKREFQRRV